MKYQMLVFAVVLLIPNVTNAEPFECNIGYAGACDPDPSNLYPQTLAEDAFDIINTQQEKDYIKYDDPYYFTSVDYHDPPYWHNYLMLNFGVPDQDYVPYLRWETWVGGNATVYCYYWKGSPINSWQYLDHMAGSGHSAHDVYIGDYINDNGINILMYGATTRAYNWLKCDVGVIISPEDQVGDGMGLGYPYDGGELGTNPTAVEDGSFGRIKAAFR
jgi:hypothetical protein